MSVQYADSPTDRSERQTAGSNSVAFAANVTGQGRLFIIIFGRMWSSLPADSCFAAGYSVFVTTSSVWWLPC